MVVSSVNIDNTSRRILHILQMEMPTNLTHEEIASEMEVSASTVSNRLQSLKEDGVLQDFQPKIDYEKAGAPHHVLFVCSAPIDKRQEYADKAIDTSGVVNIRELLRGNKNLHIEVVCLDAETVECVAEELHSIGLDIEHSEILRREYDRPFNHFGKDLGK